MKKIFFLFILLLIVDVQGSTDNALYANLVIRAGERQLLQFVQVSRKVRAASAHFGEFRGSLSVCQHSDEHDVHWIDDRGHFTHFIYKDNLSATKYIARLILQKNPHVVVIIFRRGFEVYDQFGNLLDSGGTLYESD